MKTIFKKKKFWIVSILVIAIIVIITIFTGKPKPEELITTKVQRGSLNQTVTATGKIESATETDLNFSVSGKLWQLNSFEGEQVKAGQLLAQLESAQPLSKVASANAQVAEAQADLNKILAGASSEDLDVSIKSVSSAQTALESAQIALQNSIATQNQGILNIKNDLLDTVSDAIFSSKEALGTIDDILSSNYSSLLSNSNRGAFYQTDGQYPITESILDNLEDDYNNYSLTSSISELNELAGQTLSTLYSVDGLLDDAYDMMSKSIPLGSLTQTIIDTYKSNIETEQASIATKISSTQTAKSNLGTENLAYQTSVDEAEAQVDVAEKELALQEAQLTLKGAGPRDFEVELYEARLMAAKANLQSALADLENYKLRAPIDGLLTNINYEIGEFVSSAEPLLSLIGESNLEINMDVSESDISKIKLGDQVEITLDAFTDEKIFQGHVAFVDPAETIINDVVYYQVKVTFDQTEEEVKSGMTANVTVLTANRKDIIYIPSRAVIIKDNKRIVRVLENDQKLEKEVVTGLRGDDGLIEILDGLEEGETIITYIKNGK